MDLRALTFNIRYDTDRDGFNSWPYRRDLAIQTVADQQCHVVAFQEVLAHQRADLEAGLDGYQWLGCGRDADGGGEQCCLAVRDDLTVLESSTFWLCPTPDVPGSVGWDAQMTRICTWARLAQADREFAVFNTHWDHQGQMARLLSARLLRERIASILTPVLLAGDLNSAPNSEPLATLCAALQDTFAVIHPGSQAGTFHDFGRQPQGPRIDYLLAGPEFLVVDVEILGGDGLIFPSDHFPVLGLYELQG